MPPETHVEAFERWYKAKWEELQRSLFPVPGPDGFLLPQRITITIPRHRSPSPADLQFVKACGERLRVRLAAAIPET